MKENDIMLDASDVLGKGNVTQAYVYDGSLLEDVIRKRFEKTIEDVTRELGGKPTNRKQYREFKKKATKEYNKRSFVKSSSNNTEEK